MEDTMKKSVIILLMLVLTASAVAQQTVKIDLMLDLRNELSLNDGQVKKIQDIRSDLKRRCIKIEADYKLGEVALDELKENTAKNLKAIEKKYHDLASLKANREFAPVEALVKAEALLTPEQREKFSELRNPFSTLGYRETVPDKEHLFMHEGEDGKVWVQKAETADNPKAVYEFKTQDGKGAVWHVKQKVRKDKDGNVVVDLEKQPVSGKHHHLLSDDSDKEMKYDVWVTDAKEREGKKTVKIVKKIGEGDEIDAETIILEDVDIDEIVKADGESAGNKVIKIRISDGDEHHALTGIKEVEDEDIKKIMEENHGKNIMIIKHADGKTEVIKDSETIEKKVKELKAGKAEQEAGQKVIVKKIEKEEEK